MAELFSVGVILLTLLFMFWLYILLPAGMAERRGRSQFFWVIVSLITSPLLACPLLWLLGDAEE